jgi:hypothetical protein
MAQDKFLKYNFKILESQGRQGMNAKNELFATLLSVVIPSCGLFFITCR